MKAIEWSKIGAKCGGRILQSSYYEQNVFHRQTRHRMLEILLPSYGLDFYSSLYPFSIAIRYAHTRDIPRNVKQDESRALDSQTAS